MGLASIHMANAVLGVCDSWEDVLLMEDVLRLDPTPAVP